MKPLLTLNLEEITSSTKEKAEALFKTLVETWSGRNVKLETVIMDITHYPSLEKAIQHCKRLDTGNRVRLFLDGNFDTPIYPAAPAA